MSLDNLLSVFSNFWYHCKAAIHELAKMTSLHKFAREVLVDALSSLYIIVINRTHKREVDSGIFSFLAVHVFLFIYKNAVCLRPWYYGPTWFLCTIPLG